MFPTVRGPIAAAGGKRPYSQILIADFGANEVWPLVDISSGTTIHAAVNPARNGTLTGWDLQNVTGPVDGTLAPNMDGVNDFGDINTASLNSIVSLREFSIGIYGKVNNIGNWTDGVNRRLIRLFCDGSNEITIFKTNGVNTLLARVLLNGTSLNLVHNTSTTNWFFIGFSSSLTGNTRAFNFNGAEVSSGAGLVAPSNENLTVATIGSAGGPTQVWNGSIAYVAVKFGAIWTETDFLNMYNARLIAGAG